MAKFVIICISIFYLILIVNTTESRSFKFSNQTEAVLKKATNYATLQSGPTKYLPSKKFTICASIYIGFFRSFQSFYTIRENLEDRLWFGLSAEYMNLEEGTYKPIITYFGGAWFSNTGNQLALRPHAWSHACTAVDGETGQVTVVINGVTTHDTKFRGEGLVLSDEPLTFEGKLFLGLYQYQSSQSSNNVQQSEASSSNVNIFSSLLNPLEMLKRTTTLPCTPGDFLAWTQATWVLSGNVETLETSDACGISYNTQLYLLPNKFYNWFDCIHMCPKLQRNGRVPMIRSLSDAENIVQTLKERSPEYQTEEPYWLLAPFIYSEDGKFLDFYTRDAMPPNLWGDGQPNGGLSQQCSGWYKTTEIGPGLYDSPCGMVLPGRCLCQFTSSPIMYFRGLCKGSNIDTHYVLVVVENNLVFKGVTGTEIKYSGSGWNVTVNLKVTRGFTLAEENSNAVGKHTWSISKDPTRCVTLATDLKMTGCSEGEFTCSDGNCVGMEERCDQVLDCDDKSDELNCRIVVLEESYRKTAPPLGLRLVNKKRQVIPTDVEVSITLLDISAIREAVNEIDIKFILELEWFESRAIYHNLKTKMSQNTLEEYEIESLWVPKLVYRNNKDNFDTRSALKNSKLKINRKGNFSRSTLRVVDEIEIFEGKENPIILIQSYTKTFKCIYNLIAFPFDTQVRWRQLYSTPTPRSASSIWWWTRQTLMASSFWSTKQYWRHLRSSASISSQMILYLQL